MIDTVPRVWGIHMNEQVGSKPIDEGFIAIGWSEVGDLKNYPDREAYKTAITAAIPAAKYGATPVYAGILFRFTHEMAAGDIVVYPSKHDRMVNIGRLTGEQSHTPETDERAFCS